MTGAISFSRIVLVSYVPFFIWTFLGGHKQLFFGFSSDHITILMAFVSASLSLLLVRSVSKEELNIVLLFIAIYFFYCLSVLIAPTPYLFVARLIDHFVYMVISLGVAFFFKDRVATFLKMIAGAAVASAVVVVLAWLCLGLGSWGRVTIPVYTEGSFSYFPGGYETSADPNVLAFFLYVGAITLLYGFFDRRWTKLALAVVMFAGILTFSRSGFVSFFMAVVAYAFVLAAGWLGKGADFKISISKLFVSLTIFAVAFFLVVQAVLAYFPLIKSRVFDYSSNSDRLQRLHYFIETGFVNPLRIIFGHGLGATRESIDPHLFYLSVVYDTGLISLMFVLFAIVWPVFRLFKIASVKTAAYAAGVGVFFLTNAMFYWQVRTYYFVVALLFVLYLSASDSKKRSLKSI